MNLSRLTFTDSNPLFQLKRAFTIKWDSWLRQVRKLSLKMFNMWNPGPWWHRYFSPQPHQLLLVDTGEYQGHMGGVIPLFLFCLSQALLPVGYAWAVYAYHQMASTGSFTFEGEVVIFKAPFEEWFGKIHCHALFWPFEPQFCWVLVMTEATSTGFTSFSKFCFQWLSVQYFLHLLSKASGIVLKSLRTKRPFFHSITKFLPLLRLPTQKVPFSSEACSLYKCLIVCNVWPSQAQH